LVDWLRQWAKTEEEREEVYVRGFLGKMIFSGEEALKTMPSFIRWRKSALYVISNDDDSSQCVNVRRTNQSLGFGIDYRFQ
jgi:hypothetical protein